MKNTVCNLVLHCFDKVAKTTIKVTIEGLCIIENIAGKCHALHAFNNAQYQSLLRANVSRATRSNFLLKNCSYQMANSNTFFSFFTAPRALLCGAASLLLSCASIVASAADVSTENSPLLSKRIYWKSLTLNLSNEAKANIFLDTRVSTYTLLGKPVVSCHGTWKLNWYQGSEASGIGKLNRDDIPRSVLDQLLLNNVKIQYSVSQTLAQQESAAKYAGLDCDLGVFYKESSPRPSFNVPQTVEWSHFFRIDDPKSRSKKRAYANDAEAKRYFELLTAQKKLTNNSERANLVTHASINDYPLIKWWQQQQTISKQLALSNAQLAADQGLKQLTEQTGINEQDFNQLFADVDLQLVEQQQQSVLEKAHKRHQTIFNQKRRKTRQLEQQTCIDVVAVKSQVNELKATNIWMKSLASCTAKTDRSVYSAAAVNKKEQGGSRYLYCQITDETGTKHGKFTPSMWVKPLFGSKGYYSVAECDVRNLGNGFMVVGMNIVIDKNGFIIEFPKASGKTEQSQRFAKQFRRGQFELCSEFSEQDCRSVPLDLTQRINTESWSIEDWIEYQKNGQ